MNTIRVRVVDTKSKEVIEQVSCGTESEANKVFSELLTKPDQRDRVLAKEVLDPGLLTWRRVKGKVLKGLKVKYLRCKSCFIKLSKPDVNANQELLCDSCK